MTSPSQTAAERAAAARLLSLASHELRTPVSVVSGYLRMLQRDDSLSERQRKMIDEADRACARLVAIITELSEVAKLDDGRATLQSESLDLFTLVREVTQTTDEASDRGVRLELHGDDQPAAMLGDRAHLKGALVGLLRAVLREQPDATVVRVECQRRPDGASIIIGNAEQQKAAQTRPEASFDDQRAGLGLLLPIARRVIDGHGGRLWSPANTEGGTTVRSAIVVEMPIK